MNAFYEHHRDNIHFGYRCFDRILLNGLIQPFGQPERVVEGSRPLVCSSNATHLADDCGHWASPHRLTAVSCALPLPVRRC